MAKHVSRTAGARAQRRPSPPPHPPKGKGATPGGVGQERGFACPFRQPQMCLNLPTPHPPKPPEPWGGRPGLAPVQLRGGTEQGVLPAAPREPQLPAPEEPPPSAQRPAPSPRRRLRSRSLSPGSSRPSAPGGPFPWPAARGFSGGAALPAPGLAVPSVLRAAAARATRGARRPGLHRTPILSRTCARPRRPFGRRRGPRGI